MLIKVLLFFEIRIFFTFGIKVPYHNEAGIIGGHAVPIENMPFMASLRLQPDYFWCGGSIIHKRFILTAAHCIIKGKTYKIQVGTNQVNKTGEEYDVERIIVHEMYSSITNDYDVAVIKLAKPLKYSPKVDKIQLAGAKTVVKTNSTVEISGWGYTSPDGNTSQELLQVKVPVVGNKKCQKKYFNLFRVISKRMMCAGQPGKDSCQGDSGGPLTQNGLQVGIVSFGAKCGGLLPGVYARVSALRSWIDQTILSNL